MYFAYGRDTVLEMPELNLRAFCDGRVWCVTLLHEPFDVTQPPVRVQFISLR
jgi:hypothetical protein